MPFRIRKLPRKNLYRVTGPNGHVYAHGTTLEKAEAQVRLLRAREYTNVTKFGFQSYTDGIYRK